jgi:hypothetical protein
MSVEMAPMPNQASTGTDLAVLETREQAQALQREVKHHLQHAERGSFYSSEAETEYGAGVRAIGKGKYAEAIEHLRAADKSVSGIPNERVEIS